VIVIRHEGIGNEASKRMVTILAKTSNEESTVLRFQEYPMTVVSTVVNVVVVVGKEFHRC
jgi:hypothetical protein